MSIVVNNLPQGKDPMGVAIADYFKMGKAAKLRVFSSQFDEDEIPVKTLFRTEQQMSPLETTALHMAQGRILDVGAGSGCHSLALQAAGKTVTAIDISQLSVDVMQARGVLDARCVNLFDDVALTQTFDTILMLMNGSGIIGKLCNFPQFFVRLKQLLNPGGAVYLDSSDLRYLYENEDGTYDIDPQMGYYGEIDYRMQYKQVKGEPFDWLYVDFQTLQMNANLCGFQAELVRQGEHYDYLAKLSLK